MFKVLTIETSGTAIAANVNLILNCVSDEKLVS